MKNKLLLLALPVMLAACSDSDTSSSSNESTASKNSQKKSCISSYIEKPCTLLTTAMVKNAYPLLPDNAEQQETKQLQACSYDWPSNGRIRTMNVAGRTMEIPVSDEIGISWIKKKKMDTALASFRSSYRTLSEEEKARAAAAMQKALDKRSEGLTESQKKMAAGMSKGFLSNMKYEAVDGVGSAAAWGGVGAGGSSLKVLDGDTEFEIKANISDVEADNKKLAAELAKSLIASCQ